MNAKRMSRLYQDRDLDPLATAVYWTEYVARHGNHFSLKPASQHLQWYELCLLDVFVTMVVATTAAAYVIIAIANRWPDLFAVQISYTTHENTNIVCERTDDEFPTNRKVLILTK